MFGVCYYPEHWPQAQWEQDAQMMSELGLTYVRIGEFAWSRLEPNPGELDFTWLDQAILTLNNAGLKVVICTPTATPPKWLIDQHPEILPVDPNTGATRGFGSRRHYDFSSVQYLQQSLRITRALALRYGSHNGIVGWQTDNELCCHDTALSGSSNARSAFQAWCSDQYSSIEKLNTDWGNVFWSMEYRDFTEIELPILAVTETSPAHRLAYRRFSSDQVVNYHTLMVAEIRQHAPDQFITHNFIPMNETAVDNFALAAPLDFTSYDNYPLGRTDLMLTGAPAEQLNRYMRTGHPDFATYYHDQTRGLLNRGFWVMEQQPGPVNWANNNPRPAPGMIRFWTLEAFAHGADCVCYFRWRQAPFAQEQMHAGLLRPDNSKTEAWPEAQQAMLEVSKLDITNQTTQSASVAIITGVEGLWVSDIEKQGEAYDFNSVQFSYYSALRELGVTVDFISVDADFSPYALIIAPSLPIIDSAFVEKCKNSSAEFVFGPRSGAKTSEFGYPTDLPPGLLQTLLPIRVLSVETLREDFAEVLTWNGRQYESCHWREQLDAANTEVIATYHNDEPAIVRSGQFTYLGTLTNRAFLLDFLQQQCEHNGVRTYRFDKDIRVVQRGALMFAFNYSEQPQVLPIAANTQWLLGNATVEPHGIAVWRAIE
ncbi:MAG: beta-galactosidase [Polaribacter sp.]|jgi:beta-galactosidase